MADENMNLPTEDLAEDKPVEKKASAPAKTRKKDQQQEEKFFTRVGHFFVRVWNRLKKFCRDTFHEMKKVVWMPKTELKKSTLLVVVAVLGVAVAIGIVDTAFSSLINFIAGLISI